jgi:hypothetical protein
VYKGSCFSASSSTFVVVKSFLILNLLIFSPLCPSILLTFIYILFNLSRLEVPSSGGTISCTSVYILQFLTSSLYRICIELVQLITLSFH